MVAINREGGGGDLVPFFTLVHKTGYMASLQCYVVNDNAYLPNKTTEELSCTRKVICRNGGRTSSKGLPVQCKRVA